MRKFLRAVVKVFKDRKISLWVIFLLIIYLIFVLKFVTISAVFSSALFGAYGILITIYILTRFLLSYFYEPIPDNDYERFLKERVPGLAERVGGGEITMDGNVIGTHSGYPFYTVGQRKGLGIAAAEALYVTGIDPVHNRVEVGTADRLRHRGLIARSVNMVKYASCTAPLRVTAKIRYKDQGGPAVITDLPDGRVHVVFDEQRRAITPGQSVVFYEGDDVVGGGIIDEVLA